MTFLAINGLMRQPRIFKFYFSYIYYFYGNKYLTGIATGLLTVFVTEAIRKQRKARFAGEAI